MPAYIILTRESTWDPAELAEYARKVPASRDGHTMTPRVRFGRFEMLEGAPIEGVVVFEFATFDEAKAWFYSPAYQDAARHRRLGSANRAFIVEGI
ncbi:DUF1330 domain-containing protein [Paraburkholderia sp.]|uniref:DUF1330 domain-containing protein n=1 Tax=Paraburkholderia sp. TaxID=1926495 RepID=UPI0039E5B149